jgi:hypothetical protein
VSAEIVKRERLQLGMASIWEAEIEDHKFKVNQGYRAISCLK